MLITNIFLGLMLAAVIFQTWVNHQGLKKRRAAPRRKKKAVAQPPAATGPRKRLKAVVPGENKRKQNHDEPD